MQPFEQRMQVPVGSLIIPCARRSACRKVASSVASQIKKYIAIYPESSIYPIPLINEHLSFSPAALLQTDVFRNPWQRLSANWQSPLHWRLLASLTELV